jgi:hypothetical protein
MTMLQGEPNISQECAASGLLLREQAKQDGGDAIL